MIGDSVGFESVRIPHFQVVRGAIWSLVDDLHLFRYKKMWLNGEYYLVIMHVFAKTSKQLVITDAQLSLIFDKHFIVCLTFIIFTWLSSLRLFSILQATALHP